jgi:hypothetical protein
MLFLGKAIGCTSTKSWRFDTVGLMLPLNDEREPHETAFTLSFDKARRRTPDNWDEFARTSSGCARTSGPANRPRSQRRPRGRTGASANSGQTTC